MTTEPLRIKSETNVVENKSELAINQAFINTVMDFLQKKNLVDKFFKKADYKKHLLLKSEFKNYELKYNEKTIKENALQKLVDRRAKALRKLSKKDIDILGLNERFFTP